MKGRGHEVRGLVLSEKTRILVAKKQLDRTWKTLAQREMLHLQSVSVLQLVTQHQIKIQIEWTLTKVQRKRNQRR
jgi:hypothetical protein